MACRAKSLPEASDYDRLLGILQVPKDENVTDKQTLINYTGSLVNTIQSSMGGSLNLGVNKRNEAAEAIKKVITELYPNSKSKNSSIDISEIQTHTTKRSITLDL
jgi:hypothetical protein